MSVSGCVVWVAFFAHILSLHPTLCATHRPLQISADGEESGTLVFNKRFMDADMNEIAPTGLFQQPYFNEKCRIFYNTSVYNDDDDSESQALGFPASLHCSHGGLIVMPPIPPEAEYAHLGNNNISNIPNNTFANCSKLVMLSLQTNSLTTLTLHVFDNLASLRSLYLDENTLSNLPVGIFRALTSLTTLNLARNPLTQLPAGVFDGLKNLVTLILSSCMLTWLPFDLFSSLTSLEKLLLSNNQISILPSGLFDRLTNLRVLKLHNNTLNNIPSKIFWSLSRAVNLSLNDNNISSIPFATFANTTSLVEIFLHDNVITQLPESMLQNSPLLAHWTLSHNRLSTLPSTLFSLSTLSKLDSFDVSHNQLTCLPPDLFQHMPKLCILTLNSNNLDPLQLESVFSHSTSVTTLILADNQWESLPVTLFTSLSHLIFLDLSSNSLTSLDVGIFNHQTKLQILSLTNNVFTTVAPGLFSQTTSLMELLLRQNSFHSIAPLLLSGLSRISYVDLSFNSITCIDSSHFTAEEMSEMAPISRVSAQGTCVTSDDSIAAGCPSGFSNNQLILTGNKFQVLSKTIFDTFMTNMLVTLSTTTTPLHLDTCCGFEWILTSPVTAMMNLSSITCNVTTVSPSGELQSTNDITELTNYRTQSACPCKHWHDSSAVNCLKLASYTYSVQGPSHTCSPVGCREGERVYATGSQSVVCVQDYMQFSLFETACQACAVPGCSKCDSSLVGCDVCGPNLNILPTSGSIISHECVDDCAQARPGFGAHGGVCVACSEVSYAMGCPRVSSDIPLTILLPCIIGGFVLVLGISVFIYIRQRRSNKHLYRELQERHAEITATHAEVLQLKRVWEIDWEDLDIGEQIGEGAFGLVYRGQWRGLDVAVKIARQTYEEAPRMHREMEREASVLQTVRHAHIVQFFGLGVRKLGASQHMFIVTELLSLGSLNTLLHDQGRVFDWFAKMRFARDIASGLALVHALGRIHRDIKSMNILAAIGDGGVITLKVADFGTTTLAGTASLPGAVDEFVLVDSPQASRFTHESYTTAAGTLLWQAPEVIAQERYGPSADVFSYGVVLYEIASQQLPWANLRSVFTADVLRRLRAGERAGPVGADWPQSFVEVLQACWNGNAAARPAIVDVEARLSRMCLRMPRPAPRDVPGTPSINDDYEGTSPTRARALSGPLRSVSLDARVVESTPLLGLARG